MRLRSIDAAELHARCSKELRLALAARAALQRLLADGSVKLSHVGRDKYPDHRRQRATRSSTHEGSSSTRNCVRYSSSAAPMLQFFGHGLLGEGAASVNLIVR